MQEVRAVEKRDGARESAGHVFYHGPQEPDPPVVRVGVVLEEEEEDQADAGDEDAQCRGLLAGRGGGRATAVCGLCGRGERR